MPLSCLCRSEQVLSLFFQLPGSTCTSYVFVFLPELPEGKIHAKWMFSEFKKNVVLHGVLLQRCYERRDWQPCRKGRQINSMSGSLYILHKRCSVVFLEYMQLLA